MERVVCKPLPLTGPKAIRQDSPAIEVMTDLRQVAAFTIRGSAKAAGLDGRPIAPTKLQRIAARPAK